MSVMKHLSSYSFLIIAACLTASCVTPGPRQGQGLAQSGTAASAAPSASQPSGQPGGQSGQPAAPSGGGFLAGILSGVSQATAGKKQPWAYWDQRPGWSDSRHWCLMDLASGTKFHNAVKGEPGRFRDGTFGIQETGTTMLSCPKLEEAGKLTIVGYASTQKAIDRVGLRNILPQYDEDQPITNQFPRVAITIIDSPPDWAITFPRPRGWNFGCWKLTATVWESNTKSRKVPEFQLCLPQDGSDEVAFGASATWPVRAEKDIPNLTGLKRTDGPRPPATVIPMDRATDERALARQGHQWQRAAAARLYYETPLGSLIGILRYQMGARDAGSESHDMRVWIVEIKS
jgi:hypothetical protein